MVVFLFRCFFDCANLSLRSLRSRWMARTPKLPVIRSWRYCSTAYLREVVLVVVSLQESVLGDIFSLVCPSTGRGSRTEMNDQHQQVLLISTYPQHKRYKDSKAIYF